MFDVSHMGQIKTSRPRGRWRSCSGCAQQRRRQARARRRPVLLPLRRRRRHPRRPLQLPARGRLLLDRLERRQPRVATSLASARSPRRLRRRGRGPRAGSLDARRPGPRGAGGGRRRSPTASCPPACTRRCLDVAGSRGAGLRHRLHRRGRRRGHPRQRRRAEALARAARRRRRPLRARRPRHPPARGLLPPARQRHGPRPQPDRGRARLVLQGGDRASPARRPSPRRAPRAPPRSSPPS